MDKLLPDSLTIRGIISQAGNSIEGLIRFERSLHSLQFKASETKDDRDKVTAVMDTFVKLASSAARKASAIPQAAADCISNIGRGGMDTYSASSVGGYDATGGKVDKDDPLDVVFGDKHTQNIEGARVTYGASAAKVVGAGAIS